MRCLRKQMRGIVLFLNSWERDSGPNRLKLSWESVVNATCIDSLVPCLQFPSGFHLRMSVWAGPLCRSGFPPFSAEPRQSCPRARSTLSSSAARWPPPWTLHTRRTQWPFDRGDGGLPGQATLWSLPWMLIIHCANELWEEILRLCGPAAQSLETSRTII